MKEREPYQDPNHVEDYEAQERRTRKRKAVYTIIDREGSTRSYWIRLGTAFINRDDSLSVYLNALPVNNKLHIRDMPEYNDSEV